MNTMNTVACTGPASRARKSASRQQKVKPSAPPPPPPRRRRSACKDMVKGCHECAVSHTRCDRARPTCERCEKRRQACSWPDQEVKDLTDANTLEDPFLHTTTITAMNPPPVLDNPALRLIDALNASYQSEPSQSIALSQSSISSRLAITTTTTTSEPVRSPEPEEDDSPPAHRGAPDAVLKISQPQTQGAPVPSGSEISSAEDDDDTAAENNDRDRNKTSLTHAQPRRVPGVIYMGSRRGGIEVPFLRFLPR